MTKFSQLVLGEGKERETKEKKKKNKLERESTFSLDFSVIGLSDLDETRSKVDPHCKSYVWVPKVWSFDKLREVEVFSYLDILCLKGHENGFGCCEAGNGYGFWFQRS